MSVNIFSEWGQLKEIVVGNCFDINKINVDLSFKLFFNDNIRDDILKNSIPLQSRLVEQRAQDLDGLAKTLEELGVRVFRPDPLKEVKSFTTPYFSDHLSPVDNPRDQVLIVGDEIIETPCIWRKRYFENQLLKPIFMHYFKQGARWSSSPRPQMKDESFDLSYVKREGQSQIDWSYYDRLEKNFEIMFDGAQCLKFGRDIVMNISNQNHRLGLEWLEKHLEDRFRIHPVELTDHHIDGMFMPLRPGVLLINCSGMEQKINLLPKALQKWDIIKVPTPEKSHYDDETLLLASSNILVNVLPINEKQVLIFGNSLEQARPLEKKLQAHGFDPIVVQLRHSRVFGGGAHCATLDTVREGSPEDYFYA